MWFDMTATIAPRTGQVFREIQEFVRVFVSDVDPAAPGVR